MNALYFSSYAKSSSHDVPSPLLSFRLQSLEHYYNVKMCNYLSLPKSDREHLKTFNVGFLSENASFNEIKEAWTDIRLKIWEDDLLFLSPEIDARRLINKNDWEKSNSNGINPIYTYGELSIENIFSLWMDLRYIKSRSVGHREKINTTFLKKIHEITMSGLPFHGFEGRRLIDRLQKKEITSEKFTQLLKKAYKENKEIAGTPHQSLVGKFRHSPLDEITHQGSSRDQNGKRYFTEREYQAFLKNPWVKLSASTFMRRPEGGYTGKLTFLPVNKVNQATHKVLNDFEEEFKAIEISEEKIGFFKAIPKIIKLEKDLLSIHPFLDGNGRTIRGLTDYLWERINLPAPLYPNEADLEMNIEESLEFTRLHMIKSINAWITTIKSNLPKLKKVLTNE